MLEKLFLVQALGKFLLILLLAEIGNCHSTETSSSEDESGSDSLDWHKSICIDLNGAYARKPNMGVICCKNETLFLPSDIVENWGTNTTNLIDCVSYLKHSPNFEFGLWNVSLCVFKKSSAFPDNKITFDNYFKFMTGAYPPNITKEIKTNTVKCAGDGNGLRKFSECFYISEKAVCNKPFKPIIDQSDEFEKKYNCPQVQGLYGQENRDYCCRKQNMPLNIVDMFIHFPEIFSNETIQNTIASCSQSFEDKQLELDPKLKADIEKYDNSFQESLLNDSTTGTESEYNPRELLIQCNMACEANPNYDLKSLTLNFDKTITSFTQGFGNKIQEDLKEIITKRKQSIKYLHEKKELSYKKLDEKFKAGKELTKIKLYCGFADVMMQEVFRAIDEYCFDKNYADHHYHH